ncbi:unnamed protein product [Adineta steineri]|uniref:C2H2-type domain-containing protein n=1 Tax=Adineta steineri TaxID=433720 RepID=A0A815BSY5_9BILA|nr:unnamed protein product [Adineta steineri]
MANKSPRYCLYRDFVDAYMKAHTEMTRCTSHLSAQTEWNAIKKNDNVVKKKIVEYLDMWNKAGQPELTPSKKTPNKKDSASKTSAKKRTLSPDNDHQNDDPNRKLNFTSPVTPTSNKRKALIEIDDLESELTTNEQSWIMRSAEKLAAKKKIETPESEKIKAPAQESILSDLNEISERIDNLIQVKSMGLLTAENQKKLKKLIEQKQQRSSDLKRLQSRQRASARFREKKKREVEKLCATNPIAAVELSKVFRPTLATAQMKIEADCPDLLQIIGEIAHVGGATDKKTDRPCVSLDDLKNAIKQRGYEISKSSLYYRLMPQRALSQDGKKHIVTVPVRLRKMQGIELPSQHEDCHFTAASTRHITDLAGIFGNDCVFYLTQDTKAKISIGRPASAKGQTPLILHLDYEISSVEPQLNSIAPPHQLTPCIYAASVIDEAGAISNFGPTYVSLRSAKHDRLTHESHAIDFDHLVQLKEFEKVARDHTGRVKPIVIMNYDSSGLDNKTRYLKTLTSAIDKFKKHNLDVLIIVNQAPGQAILNVVERRLSPISHDLAGLILPNDHFGSHLNDNGLTEHAELEKENFKLTGNVLAEVWSMNVLDEYPVVAEYINPLPIIDEQLQMADSTLALDSVIDQVCAGEEDNIAKQTRSMLTMKIKTEYDIDEYWCATHVLQTQYTIQIIRCNDASCCTPWRSNYIQVFPHRFLPAPAPFNRSSAGVKMAEIASSSAAINPISPFYGNLFQRIQFHGIVINRTKNDLLPFDACCPSIQTELPSRICSICKQYIPIAVRLRNHYQIHQQYALDYDKNSKEEIIDDHDLNDPYDIPIQSINSKEGGVHLFKDMTEWLRSDFEDDPIIDVKTKSIAATAAANIRKDKQMTAIATSQQQESMTMTQTVTEEVNEEIIEISSVRQARTTTEISNVNESQTQSSAILDALEQLAMIDDGTSSIGDTPSQISWDDLDDLIDNM